MHSSRLTRVKQAIKRVDKPLYFREYIYHRIIKRGGKKR